MKHVLKVSVLSLAAFIVLASSYSFFEPVILSAATDTTVVTLNVASQISITSGGNITMSNTLGVATNVAVGTSTWTVITNDGSGYTLGLSASTNPAMKSGSNSVADYATTSPLATWSVSSGNAKFGFSVFGTDVNTAIWGTGSFCNGAATSTPSATLKYDGFYTAATTTASRAAVTPNTGVVTTTCYAVEQNNTFIPAGVYTATITGTATAL